MAGNNNKNTSKNTKKAATPSKNGNTPKVTPQQKPVVYDSKGAKKGKGAK